MGERSDAVYDPATYPSGHLLSKSERRRADKHQDSCLKQGQRDGDEYAPTHPFKNHKRLSSQGAETDHAL